MTSYFEISGHIVECSTDGNTSFSMPSSAVLVAVHKREREIQDDISPVSVRSRGRSDIHREIQRYAFDMWTIPIRHGRPSDVIAPFGAGLRNFKLSMERNREFYDYLSE